MCKFDVVLGNPPYQEDRKGTNANFSKALYDRFIDLAIMLGKESILIHPGRFLFNAGSTSKNWNKKMLSSEHYKVLLYESTSNKIFPGTDIKGGVAVTYYNHNKVYEPIGAFIVNPLIRSILKKVKSKKEASLSDWVYAPESYRFTKEFHSIYPQAQGLSSNGHEHDISTKAFTLYPFVFLDNAPDDGHEYVRFYGRSNGTGRVYKWIRRDCVRDHENLYKWKVLLPKSNGSGTFGEELATPVIGRPVIGHTQTFLSIGALNTEEEATALLKYIKTKFCRAMLGILKVTQDNKKSTWKYVPLQDFTGQSDIDWSQSVSNIDHQLYMKYGLSEEEISFIEEKVQPMDVDNQDIDDREV